MPRPLGVVVYLELRFMNTKDLSLIISDHRMALLERILYYEGSLNLDELAGKMNVDCGTASLLLANYEKYAPGNLTMESGLYIPNDKKFFFIFSENKHENILKTLHKANSLTVHTLPNLVKFIEKEMLTKILRAITRKQQIVYNITYQSLTALDPQNKEIIPFAIYAIRNRFHLRGYCLKQKNFRDFVFSRILDFTYSHEYSGEYIVDTESMYKVELEIIPHPDLTLIQNKCIQLEYRMTNGILKACIPRSMLFYFLDEYNLSDESLKPPKTVLFLKNRDMVLKKS
jgi:hypothetical protein